MATSPARAAHGSQDLLTSYGISDASRDRTSRMRVDRSSRAEQHAAYEERQARDRERAAQAAADPWLAAKAKEREEQALSAMHRSLASTRLGIDGSLSIPCPACEAPIGRYCMPRVHGFCAVRWNQGLFVITHKTTLRPGELSPLAEATRNVARRIEAQRRHLNRNRREGGRG